MRCYSIVFGWVSMWVLVKRYLVYYYPALPLTVICATVAANYYFPVGAAVPIVVAGCSVPTAVAAGVAVVVVGPTVHHVAVVVVVGTVAAGLPLAASGGTVLVAV